jgi:hypothetical protein
MTSTLDAARAMFEADLASKSLGIELLELAEGRAVLSRIPRQQPHAPPPDLTEDSCSAEEKASEMTPFLPCGIEFPSYFGRRAGARGPGWTVPGAALGY